MPHPDLDTTTRPPLDELALVDTLQRIGSALTSEFELDRIVQLVTDEATRLTGAQFGAFFYNVLNAQGESYTLYTISGVPREEFSKFPMPRNTHVFEPTFRGTEVVRSADITRDPRYGHNPPYYGMPKGHLPVVSYLAAPVISRTGEVLGGLFFGHERADVFSEMHERLLVGIAAWAAVAVDNARLYDAERRTRREAEAANRAKSEFLATMSHELRTPLNAIGGYADLLLMGVRGELSEPQRADVLRMKRSGDHLLGLINNILNFAKLDAGQVEYQLRALHVSELLEGLEDLVRPQAAAKSLTLARERCDDDAVRVSADPDKVRQILLNLLTNAVKFTGEGGAITISCDADATWARVRVRDTGRGIAADQLRRVFDPFVQVDRHLTPATQQGVGLGLAISRDLALGMGGALEAESEVGVGSVFTLKLKRA